MITRNQKQGNSPEIPISKDIFKAVPWNGGEQPVVSKKNDKMLIKQTEKNIRELFTGFHEEYFPVEIDWDKPVGKEIW